MEIIVPFFAPARSMSGDNMVTPCCRGLLLVHVRVAPKLSCSRVSLAQLYQVDQAGLGF